MMLLNVLMTNYVSLYLEDTPNGIFVCTAVAVGCFLALVAIRTLYVLSEDPKLWIEVETARAVYGMYFVRAMAVLCVICTLFLFGRFGEDMTRSFWSTMSLNKDRW